MKLQSYCWLLAAFAASPRVLGAQDSLATIDPKVSAVVTGGHWSAEGKSGFYRVVLRTRGEVPSDLSIEWLSDPARGQGAAVVQVAKVHDLSGGGRLERPQITGYLNGWRVWVQQADPKAPSGTLTRAIDLGPPGDFKLKPRGG
jgi:hypothetical protein